jgi:hypothetical protein
LPVEIRFFFKSTGFTSSTFPIQSDFSQNQPVAITLNTSWFSPDIDTSIIMAEVSGGYIRLMSLYMPDRSLEE